MSSASDVSAPLPAAPSRKYRTEIPNLIDDLDLTPFEHRLYHHYKRVCGAAGGVCYESTTTLARHCHMSEGSIIKAKHGLAKRGLIHIKAAAPGSGLSDEITIVDIWAANLSYYSALASIKKSHTHQVSSPRSSGESKKETPSSSPQPSEKNATTRPTTEPLLQPVSVAAPVVVSDASLNAETDSRVGTDFLPLPEYKTLVTALSVVVGSEKAAYGLIRKYTAPTCKQQLEWLPHRNPEHPGKLLRKSLEEEYGEPEALKNARIAAQEAGQAALRRQQSEARHRSHQEAQDEAKRILEAWHAALPAEIKAEIEKCVLTEARRQKRTFDGLPERFQKGILSEIRPRVWADWRDGKHYV